MKNKLVIFFLILLVFSLSFITVWADEENLILNPSFETITGGVPENWTSHGFHPETSTTEFGVSETEKHGGNYSIWVNNKAENDARYYQEVNVQGGLTYRLSCWIKTENIGGNGDKRGACISIDGQHEASRSITGTNGDWEEVDLYVIVAPNKNTFKVTLGIGGYSSMNTGLAYFDDMVVTPVSNITDGAIISRVGFDEQSGNAPNNNNNNNNNNPAPQPVKEPIPGPSAFIWIVMAITLIFILAGVIYYKKTVKDENVSTDTSVEEEKVNALENEESDDSSEEEENITVKANEKNIDKYEDDDFLKKE